MAAKQGQVQADSKPGIFSRESDGFVESRFIDHQAGRSQDALAMSTDNRLVDRGGATEVVGVYDEAAKESRSTCWGRSRSSGCGAGRGS